MSPRSCFVSSRGAGVLGDVSWAETVRTGACPAQFEAATEATTHKTADETASKNQGFVICVPFLILTVAFATDVSSPIAQALFPPGQAVQEGNPTAKTLRLGTNSAE